MFPLRCGRGRWGYVTPRRSTDRYRTIREPDLDQTLP